MNIRLIAAFVSLTFLSIATIAEAQWIASAGADPTTATPPVPSLRTQGYVSMGPDVSPYADTTLRLTYPVGGSGSTPCSTFPTAAERCFLLSFGSPTAQYFGFRLDANHDLHLSRQASGWFDGVTFGTSGDTVINGFVRPLKLRTNVAAYAPAEAEFGATAQNGFLGLGLTFPGGDSYISVAGLRVGLAGGPTIQSDLGPLYLNYSNSQNVIIGTSGGTGAMRVEGSGTSFFKGAVEIGTTSAPANLNVTGTLTGGVIQAKYQDVAEWVPASEELVAGTVVVLDRQKSNHVKSSTSAYDASVAGVISPRPGIALGEEGDAKALVATTGRVRVRVDATKNPVAIGDLLVTSDRKGVAMKSIPIDLQGVAIHRPGTVLGKALEPLPGGEGEILVLLSLQ